ncbi:putative bifunctional diguanylate cyclase/phosphodiesterase [Maritalea mediterranea]|uniref:EAL domain-containing protein n=1 Tax=Maritalea mediterranea TaxID=2909667 RepID=A0ABS9EAF7_9HYPH|nr:EAL domain-containing protein [Maritalea mediterranea]MCF4098879.1 EAL domain-containing protein [Maritalea mediterranea]
MFTIDGSNEPLIRAQLRMMQVRLPFVYFLTFSALLVIGQQRLAHGFDLPTVVGSGVLIALSIWRLVYWVRFKATGLSAEQVRKKLQTVAYSAGLLGFVFTSWTIFVCTHDNSQSYTEVGIFVLLSLLGGLFCLAYLRQAALMLILSVSVPMFSYSLVWSAEFHSALTLHFIFIVGIITVITHFFGRDFETFIDQRSRLYQTQADAKAQAEEMRFLAYKDVLTDLDNRRGFFHFLRRKFPNSDGHSLTLGLIDLDGFKPINDIYGHPSGDDLLRKIAHRLVEFLGEEVFVARVGGDEFALVTLQKMTDHEIIALGRAICAALKVPFVLKSGVQVKLSASLGFARAGVDASDPETLFERADHALYYAKTYHLGHALLFEPKHERVTRDSAEIAQGLRDSQFIDEMEMIFQPVVSAENNNVTCVEALARWHRPDGLEILPDTFIPVAEAMGLMNKLTLALFEKATDCMLHWTKYLKLSFNLSASDVVEPHVVRALMDITHQKGISPNRIIFEISENVLYDQPEQAQKMLERLAGFGFSISLDDFGGRLSNFSHLHQLPIYAVKLDSELICDLRFSTQSRILVRKIVELAQGLNLRVVAQGISSSDHLHVLEGLGCEYYQGFHFARPMSQAKLLNLLHQQNGHIGQQGVA